ncbi:MAG: saccharopine dehydrogenase NADP-binding domain-containing protein [Elusimicrobia bacterium]|nr:saccharopine dehydrogenase NADP-binding domain-containing protein [Elusimicrobiota bacterium]
MKITVLGAGLVGSAMAKDLAKERGWEITVSDLSKEALAKLKGEPGISVIQSDLAKSANVQKLIKDADIVVGAMPGFMGLETLKTIIEASKNVVDISFFPEDPFLLDSPAKKHNVTAIVDCGVAPGCSNMLTGYAAAKLDKAETCLCYVGGLPRVREWPYEYKIVFSAVDVIEEYTRPARYIENGKAVVRPALSDPELLDFPEVGTLEAFNTDGLRTLAKTLDAPNMKEKTMRYPGHIDKMRVLRETGFFRKEPIKVGDVSVSPMAVTAKLMFPLWKLKEGEEDFTVMRVIVAGKRAGKNVKYVYDLYDKYDPLTKTTSMARTTGYAGTAAVRMLAKKVFSRKGVCPPEYIGQEEKACKFMLKTMEERNIIYKETITERKSERCECKV